MLKKNQNKRKQTTVYQKTRAAGRLRFGNLDVLLYWKPTRLWERQTETQKSWNPLPVTVHISFNNWNSLALTSDGISAAFKMRRSRRTRWHSGHGGQTTSTPLPVHVYSLRRVEHGQREDLLIHQVVAAYGPIGPAPEENGIPPAGCPCCWIEEDNKEERMSSIFHRRYQLVCIQ